MKSKASRNSGGKWGGKITESSFFSLNEVGRGKKKKRKGKKNARSLFPLSRLRKTGGASRFARPSFRGLCPRSRRHLYRRIVWWSGARLPPSQPLKMTSASIDVFQCSTTTIDGGGRVEDDGKTNSFSFGSTALALSCDELPPSPCLQGVRGSKVRDLNGGVESGAEGVSALRARERSAAVNFFVFFRKKKQEPTCSTSSSSLVLFFFFHSRLTLHKKNKTPHSAFALLLLREGQRLRTGQRERGR